MDLKAQYVQNYKLNVAGKNPIPHLSVIVSLKQTTKVCIQQSNSEKDDKYNTESRRYSCIFTYGTKSGTGEVFRYRETFNTLISVSVSFKRRFAKISQSRRRPLLGPFPA